MLLSFAQFEREVTGERIRDKIAASKKKGMWMGGSPPLGYIPRDRTLSIDEEQAARVREIFRLYVEFGDIPALKEEVDRRGWVSPLRTSRRNKFSGGCAFSRGKLRKMLENKIYRGQIEHKGVVYQGQHPSIIDEPLWQAVQDKLGTMLTDHHTRRHADAPCLLAGLVFGDDGQKFSVSHAKKQSRRYRYYVMDRKGKGEDRSHRGAARIPALDLEEVVIDALIRFLNDEPRLQEFLGASDAAEMPAPIALAATMAQKLQGSDPSDQIDVLRVLLSKVVVHREEIELILRRQAFGVLGGAVTEATPEGKISVPAKMRRSGMAMRIVVHPPTDEKSRGPDPKLGALISKAHDWLSRLTSGRYDGVQAIATEETVTSSYVTRVIYVALMAPDLALRILKGEHPRNLNARTLLSLVPLPEQWDEQRQLLGMKP